MDKKQEYSKILLNAYNNDLFKIIWNTSGFSLGIDSKRKDNFPELKEKKFIEYAFSIIKIIADIAEDNIDDNISEEDLKVAREIYNLEKDLKNHLFIKKNSNIEKGIRFSEINISMKDNIEEYPLYTFEWLMK